MHPKHSAVSARQRLTSSSTFEEFSNASVVTLIIVHSCSPFRLDVADGHDEILYRNNLCPRYLTGEDLLGVIPDCACVELINTDRRD